MEQNDYYDYVSSLNIVWDDVDNKNLQITGEVVKVNGAIEGFEEIIAAA